MISGKIKVKLLIGKIIMRNEMYKALFKLFISNERTFANYEGFMEVIPRFFYCILINKPS